MDVTGPYIEIVGPHEEFFSSIFLIWIGGKNSDGCCIPIRMHKVWTALGLRHNIVGPLSSLWNEVYIIRAIVVPGKHGMSVLILALKGA